MFETRESFQKCHQAEIAWKSIRVGKTLLRKFRIFLIQSSFPPIKDPTKKLSLEF